MWFYLQFFDYKAFQVFNALAGKNVITDALFIFLGVYLVYFFTIVVIGYWFVNRDRLHARTAVVLAFVSFIASRFVFTELIRILFDRNRPYLTYNVVELINKGSEASFPSGHASAMFAIATAIYLYNKKLGFWLYLCAAVTCMSRIIIGVHYPSDIIAGAVLGIMVAGAFNKYLHLGLLNLARSASAFTDRALPSTQSFTKPK